MEKIVFVALSHTLTQDQLTSMKKDLLKIIDSKNDSSLTHREMQNYDKEYTGLCDTIHRTRYYLNSIVQKLVSIDRNGLLSNEQRYRKRLLEVTLVNS